MKRQAEECFEKAEKAETLIAPYAYEYGMLLIEERGDTECQSAFKFDPLSASKNDPQKGKKKLSFRPLSTFAWQPSELNHFSPARMGQSAARRSRRKMVERVGTNMVTSCF